MNVSIDELFEDIVKRILKEDKKFVSTVFVLAYEACVERCGEASAKEIMKSDEMDDMLFDLESMLKKQAKERGYTMRLVPCKEEGGRWGLPYNFEYYFSTKQAK